MNYLHQVFEANGFQEHYGYTVHVWPPKAQEVTYPQNLPPSFNKEGQWYEPSEPLPPELDLSDRCMVIGVLAQNFPGMGYSEGLIFDPIRHVVISADGVS